jgi:hypothetical protein
MRANVRAVMRRNDAYYPNKVVKKLGAAIISILDLNYDICPDRSGNNRPGVATGIDLSNMRGPDGRPAPYFDGLNDFVTWYSDSLKAAMNYAEGYFGIWLFIPTSVWTDNTYRRFLYFDKSDTTNRIVLEKTSNANNNQLQWRYKAGGTEKLVTGTTHPTGWFHMGLNWNKSGDEVQAFLKGLQEGSIQRGLGTWSGAIDQSSTTIGASFISPTLQSPHLGCAQYPVLCNRPLTTEEAHIVGTK